MDAADTRPGPPLTVVVVTRGSQDTLRPVLDALVRAAPLGSELVVVENGGDHAVEDLVQAVWPAATVVVSQYDVGYAVAVNAGLGLSAGEAVLLLAPTAAVEPATIKTLLRALADRPAAGIVAPRLADTAGRSLPSGYSFPTPATVAARRWQPGARFPSDGPQIPDATLAASGEAPVPVDWAAGACLLVRRSVLEQVGRMDPDYFEYAEDVDLAKRAAAAGWRTYLVPAARARLHGDDQGHTQTPLLLASRYLAPAVYFLKHGTRGQQAALLPLLLLDLTGQIAQTSVRARFGQAAAAERLRAYRQAAHLLRTQYARLPLAWRAFADEETGAAEQEPPEFPHPPHP